MMAMVAATNRMAEMSANFAEYRAASLSEPALAREPLSTALKAVIKTMTALFLCHH